MTPCLLFLLLFSFIFPPIWYFVQFHVNATLMIRQNLSLWKDKTAMIPPFCRRICFILTDALQSSKGGVHHVLTKSNLTTASLICSPCSFQKLETIAPCVAASPVRMVNTCQKKKKVRHHPEASLSFWCTLQTTPYIKNPSYLFVQLL